MTRCALYRDHEVGFANGRFIGLVRPQNAASIRVLEKVGMQPEGDMVYDGMKVLRFAKRR